MVIKKFYVGMILIVLTLGSLYLNSSIVNDSSSSLNHNVDFPEWRPNNQTLSNLGCSCHNYATVPGTGSISVAGSTSVESLTYFDLQVQATGFTQANGNNIVMGFNILDDNNSLFTNNVTLYKSNIAVDGSGSSSSVNFSFKSPLQGGSYNLLMYAVWSKSGSDIYYISKVIPLTVTQVVDTTKPVFNSLLVNDKAYSNNMEVNGTVFLKADITDAHMSEVVISTNGVDFTQMTYDSSSQNYLYNFSTSSFTGNSLTVNITAINKAGLSATKDYTFSLNSTGSNLPQADILSYKIDQSINMNDGKVDPAWDDIPGTAVSEFGSKGLIKTADDGVYLYTLLEYDSSLKWVAIQFNVSDSNPICMDNGYDGWVFGTDSSGDVVYHGDYYFVGETTPVLDKQNDVFFESFTQNGITYIEAARLLDTHDTAGHDFNFTLNSKFYVYFASSQDHTSQHTPMSWIVTNDYPAGVNASTNPIGPIKTALDLQQISDAVFVVSFVIVIVTVFIHIALRVVSKPIKHEKRIIYTHKLPDQPSSLTVIKNFITNMRHKKVEEKK